MVLIVHFSCAWCFMPIIPEMKRLRHKNHCEVKTSLGYIASSTSAGRSSQHTCKIRTNKLSIKFLSQFYEISTNCINFQKLPKLWESSY